MLHVVVEHLLPRVFLLCGACLLIWGFVSVARTLSFLWNAIESPGEVVALEEGPGAEEGGHTYRSVVSYFLASGHKVTFNLPVASYPPAHEIGERVRVLYEANRPDEARLRSFDGLWLSSVVLLGLGAVSSIVGAGLLFFMG